MRRTARAMLAVGAALAWASSAPLPVSAQWSAGPVSAGMGGAGLVFATGHEAVAWNPANLGFGSGWSFVLLDVGGAGLLRGTTVGDLVDILSAGGEGDRAVVDRLPDDGFRVSTALEGFVLDKGADVAGVPSPGSALPSLALSIGPVGLRVRSQVLGEATMSRELADLTVSGFNPERIQEYAVRQTGFRSTSFTEVTLGYGHAFGSIALGGNVRWVRGNRLAQGRFFEPDIDLENESLRVTGVAVESAGGTGWGVDVGMAADLGGGFRWSLAARNVFQRMTWDEDLRTHQATFTDTDFDSSDLADLVDRFGDEPLDPTAVDLQVLEAATDLFRQAYFPTVAHTGLGWSGSSGTRIEVVASAVAPRGRQHADWDQRIAGGIEQRLKFLVLRAGAARSENGLQALSVGFGLRAGPVRYDVGVGRMSGSSGGTEWDGLQASMGLSIVGGGR